MANLKQVVTDLRQWLGGHSSISETTFGDVNEVDLSTRTDFPLAHIIPLSTDYEGGVAQHNFQILFLDKFLVSEEDKIDVLDRMNEVASDFSAALENGTILTIVNETTYENAEVMYDQLVNRLYGYSMNVGIRVQRDLSC